VRGVGVGRSIPSNHSVGVPESLGLDWERVSFRNSSTIIKKGAGSGAEVMSMATWRGIVLGALCLALAGCEEPKLIVPAHPPGAELPPPPEAENEAAQAIGEMGPAAAEKPGGQPKMKPAYIASPTAPGETKTTISGVKYETLKPGDGPEATFGSTAQVHYTGTLENGKEFDSSRGKGTPFAFRVGDGQVIRGWEEGVLGMKVGERRKLVIPPAVAYGSQGQGSIPPNSTLIFDIELLKVEPAAQK
jgi:FKBP-type peptidyl-prolyl cis-trans isomerase